MDKPPETFTAGVSDLGVIQDRLGHRFCDESLLRLALTHPSLARELTGPGQHNQRLEFLGDAVLQLALTRELYDKFPEGDEGLLTKARAKLVNQQSVAKQARQLGLGEYLLLSRGEEASGGRDRPSILADALEAVLGALFIDAGFQRARDLILQLFAELFNELEDLPSLDNPKGELQELLQGQSEEAPEYRLVSATGPDHDRAFECAVYFHGREQGRGEGKSKKAAESQAARVALENLRRAKGH